MFTKNKPGANIFGNKGPNVFANNDNYDDEDNEDEESEGEDNIEEISES